MHSLPFTTCCSLLRPLMEMIQSCNDFGRMISYQEIRADLVASSSSSDLSIKSKMIMLTAKLTSRTDLGELSL